MAGIGGIGIDEFEGDVLLGATPDGGDIMLRDGLIVADTQVSTAVYLSLFGGNKRDNGKTINKDTWWGNLVPGISQNQKMVSRFQNVITGLPLSVKNIREAEQAALLDLEWLKSEGEADEITVSVAAMNRDRFELRVDLRKNGVGVFVAPVPFEWGDNV